MSTQDDKSVPADVIADLRESKDRYNILKHMEKGGAMKLSQVTKNLKMLPGNVHHHTDILHKQELIRKWTGTLRRSYVQITEKGKRALDVLGRR
jgi:DNA-binding MarR family transcriptional regulator